MVQFSTRFNQLDSSDIGEILKLIAKNDIISFAGGLPADELFPIEYIKKATNAVFENEGARACQYSTSEGFLSLREKLVERMRNKQKINAAPSDLIITSGSQQGLDFAARVFLDKDDVVLVESPSYLGALNAFKACEPKFIEVPTDNNGMIIEELEKILATTQRVKMIYVIADFQNPTGRTWSLERRKKFIEIINKYEIPVIEDNPYGELRFENEHIPAIKSFDTKGLVVYLGTFSKTMVPGFRLGWVCASEDILAKFDTMQQAAALQASSLAQLIAVKFLDSINLDDHVKKLCEAYKRRRDAMMNAIKEHFPPEVKYVYPDGGLFTWVEMPPHINTREMALKCIEKNIAYVPGSSFFPNGGVENCFRLNYSSTNEENIKEGIKRLGEVMREVLK